jgi:asparagine N-glycosylation enzyme membrane subunit Stt3
VALEQIHGRSSGVATAATVTAALVALLALVFFERSDAPRYDLRVVSTAIALCVALALEGLRRVLLVARLPARLVGLGVVAVPAVAGMILFVVAPSTASDLLAQAGRLIPSAGGGIGEARPLFFTEGGFSLMDAWYRFRAPFFVGLAMLGPLAWRVCRRAEPAASLVLVSGVATLAATLGQVRFGYYLAGTLALLTGWMAASLPSLAAPAPQAGTSARRTVPRGARPRRPNPVVAALAGAAVAVTVVAPAAYASLGHALQDYGMPPPWHETLDWLRLNSPEPFTEPRAYEAPPAGRGSYTIMNWWESGYWVAREGRRVPVANPTQSGIGTSARYLTATDPAEAERLAAAAASRFVVVSDDLVYLPAPDGAFVGKFDYLPRALGESPGRYFDIYHEYRGGATLRQVVLFHEDYFQTLASRLLLFDGRAVQPVRMGVISWVPRTGVGGQPLKEIVASREFTSYPEARAYLEELGEGNHAIVSRSPMETCVPLETLTNYRLAFESGDGAGRPTGRGSVRVFERLAQVMAPSSPPAP